jgi:hypothetical protein
MNTKHTPGPWSIWTSNSYRRIGSDTTGKEVVTGSVQRDGHPDLLFPNGGFTGPDALLIAAAPELLEQLESLYTWLADYWHEWPGRNMPSGQIRLGRMRDVIAKATGRSEQDVQDDYGTRAARGRATGEQA